jgi:hypothetical protein
MTDEELVGVLKWMTTKYAWRDKKDRLEDFGKIRQYIDMITEELGSRAKDQDSSEKEESSDFIFPESKFVKTNSALMQVHKIISELREATKAAEELLSHLCNSGDFSDTSILRDFNDELCDVIHAYETLRRMDNDKNLNYFCSVNRVISKNRDRGYYDPES